LPEDRQAGLVQILFDCIESLAHCARGCPARQPEFLFIAVNDFGNVEKHFRARVLPRKRAHYPMCLDTAPCSKNFLSANFRSGFFFDSDFDLRGDVSEDFDGHLRFADDFNRLGKLHLALVNFEALRGKTFGNIR